MRLIEPRVDERLATRGERPLRRIGASAWVSRNGAAQLQAHRHAGREQEGRRRDAIGHAQRPVHELGEKADAGEKQEIGCHG